MTALRARCGHDHADEPADLIEWAAALGAGS